MYQPQRRLGFESLSPPSQVAPRALQGSVAYDEARLLSGHRTRRAGLKMVANLRFCGKNA